MHLKLLTIKGFKSFAEPASIRLEPGVTVVVGPNGSGKSNVVDALAWALGAQAPSAVRSARMDDVIFAGTANKPALGRAEVSVTIDNSDASLPLAASEVRITRCLFRNGESSYALNGSPCRLLDITELLSDAGVGRQQHMIVSQNQIDAVLNARPADRRGLVEEAAGILKFRKRRERAERRLFASDADLTRMSDLLRELRRRLNPLEKQAAAARRHSGLLAELTELRICLAGREITDMRDRLRDHKQRREAQAELQAELRAELERLGERVAADEQSLARHGIADHSERLAQLEGLRARAQGQGAVVAERLRSIERQRAAAAGQDLLASLQAEAGQCRRELATVMESLEASHAEKRRTADLRERLEAEHADFEARSPQATERSLRRSLLTAAQEALSEASSALNEAVEARAKADGELRHWTARGEALAMALEEAATEAPAAADATEGAVGLLADLVTVEPGCEAAFAAAAGEAVGSVVVRDAAAARQLLDSLEAGDTGVAALVLDSGTDSAAGTDSPAAAVGGALPPLSEDPDLGLLRGRVRCDDREVERCLDLLLASTVLVDGDWRAAADVWCRRRDLVVVTPAGDRLSARGWRLGAHSTAGLRPALDEANQRIEDAEKACRQALEACETARSRQSLHSKQAEEAAAQLAEAESSVAAARAGLQQRSAEVAAAVAEHNVAEAGLQQHRRMLEARIHELDSRLRQHHDSRAETTARMAAWQRETAVLDTLKRVLEQRTSVLDDGLSRIRELNRRASQEVRVLAAGLDDLRQRYAAAESRHEAVRQAENRRDVEEAELRTLLQGAVERLRDDHGLSPQQAAETLLPELSEGLDAAQRMAQLSNELEIMGPVNPLALSEYDELYERHELMKGQLEDIRAARRDLNKVIRLIDREIQATFSSAFVDVASNFEVLFDALFPGGEGRLSLSDPDDLLGSGIEISAKPSGKNVKRLSLLSGGERTLAALAFLFAVFRSRPAPFYVMDEVEAALDDVNLHRFLKLLEEFRNDAQLVIVTHQKRTMEAADCLQGVSMKPGGSSMVVSERVSDAA
ncbi:MAG: AAA family ATPase [Acidimicrobiaceae bacterium]|nr:AAA family ATPase [Acidimicrobiaceae bacterium]